MSQSRYADVSSLLADVYEGAYFVLRASNLLVRTVTVFTDNAGMTPRKASVYGSANPRAVAEGEDVTATPFNRTLLNTLTPARYADQVVLTDERIATDAQNVRADAALEMGGAFAEYVDRQLAGDFANLTGGTVGTAGTALTWANIMRARAVLQNSKVPGPYYCALHPYQWVRLVESAAISGSELKAAPGFQDALVSTYFTASILGGVTFVITPAIATSGNDATGAMYSPMALAYDERRPFNMRPERDESRESYELNFSMWFAHGVWRPTLGIKLIGLATLPTT